MPTPQPASSDLLIRVESLERDLRAQRHQTRVLCAALLGTLAALWLLGAKEDGVLRGEGLELRDSRGQIVFAAYPRMDGATLELRDGRGHPRLRLSSVEGGRLELTGLEGPPSLRLHGGDTREQARMSILNAVGRRVVDVSIDPEGRGHVDVFDRQGIGKSLLPMPSQVFGTRYGHSIPSP